jgi:cobyrinic acid a,c-diamide synthase
VVFIGGGFPEAHAERLEENTPSRKVFLDYIKRGGKLYAECNGLMYLACGRQVGT